MPSGVGGVVSTSVAPSGPAVRASRLAPSCSPCARTARLTAWRCMLASRRNAAAVAPVGTLDVPRATRMLVVDVSSRSAGGPGVTAEDRRHGLQQPVGGQRGNVALHEAAQHGGGEPGPRGQVVGLADPSRPAATRPATKVSWLRRTTSAPRPAAMRWATVRLSSANQPSRSAAARARRPATRRTAAAAARACRAGRRRRPAASSTAAAAGGNGVAAGPVGRSAPNIVIARAAAGSGGDVRMGGGGEDPSPAERGRRVLRPVEALGHRLDVVGDRGRELPEVVHRQLDRFDRRDVPRRRGHVADRLATRDRAARRGRTPARQRRGSGCWAAAAGSRRAG